MKKFFWLISFFVFNIGVYTLSLQNKADNIKFIILSAFVAFIFIYLLIIANSKKINIEKIFIIITFTIGMLYMVATPMFRVADEELHFYRAYEVSEGHFISDMQNGVGGRQLPYSLKQASPSNTLSFNYNQLKQNMNIPLEENKLRFIEFPTAALYSPVSYIPQSIGILVGRLMHINPVFIGYIGRFFNLLVCIILWYFSLKNLRFKPFIFLVALLPMSLHIGASLSPDAFINSIALFFLTYIIKISYYEQSKKVNKVNITFLIIMAVIISLCKIVYLPLWLLLLIIPINKWSNKRSYWIFQICAILICVILNLCWLKISSGFLLEVKEGVNAFEQIKFILTNPIKYVFIILHTTSVYFNMYLHSMVGANLCLMDVPVFYWISNLYLLILLYLIIHQNDFKPKKIDKYIALFVSLSIFILINTSLYIQWTKVGLSLIDGIQGRYFLPILPLIIFAFSKKIDSKIITSNNIINMCIILNYPVLLTLIIKHL